MSGQLRHIELGFLLRDARVRWVFAIFVLLCLPAFILALQDTKRVSAEFEQITAVERDRWLNQSPKNPHSADHFGTWVFKPVSPLSPLDRGVTPYLGQMVRIEAHVFNDAVFQSVQDANAGSRSGFSSIADITQTLLPLLMFLLGFAAFAADRERGTIRLALGNGASPASWVAARLGAMAVIACLATLLPLVVLGSVSVLAADGAGWQPWLRLVLWLLAQAVYGGIFLLLGFAISLASKTVRSALIAALLAWVVLCIAVPRASTAFVELASPTPSYQDTRIAIERETRAFNEAEISATREQEFLARYGAERAEDLPVDLRGAMLHARDEHDNLVFDKWFGKFFAELAAQDRVFGWTGIASPKNALEAVSEAITGNDFANHTSFVWAAEAYRRNLSDTMNKVLMASPQKEGVTIKTSQEVWAEVPPFSHRPRSVWQALGGVMVPVSILLGWFLVAAIAVYWLSRRMKP